MKTAQNLMYRRACHALKKRKAVIIAHDLKSQLMDNIPYSLMIVFGVLIFLFGLGFTATAFVAAGLYVLYGFLGIFLMLIFVCSHCANFGSNACVSGYGKFAARLVKRKDRDGFTRAFKSYIPFIVPIWAIPALAGIAFLILSFSALMLALVVLFMVISYAILPMLSTKYACARCPQRDKCPWMGKKRR
jgi:hypothetical protein